MTGKIIAGFPGVGKSTLLEQRKDMLILDSDSSSWPKEEGWAKAYVEHLIAKANEGYTVLCSTHKEVRDALVEAGQHFILVQPFPHQKAVYLERYRRRGSPREFVEMMDAKWSSFMIELRDQTGCRKVMLWRTQFLVDIIDQDGNVKAVT